MSHQTVNVDGKALRDVLEALIGQPHQIRELQMTRSIAKLTGYDPIGKLIDDYNLAVVGGGPPRCQHCEGTGYEPAPYPASPSGAGELRGE